MKMDFVKKACRVAISLAAAVTALLSFSCSVKEDRVPCPCYLNVSFEDREDIDSEVGLLGWNNVEMFRAGINVEDYDPYWVKAVHKSVFFFSAYRGVDRVTAADHYVTIKPGNQSDSLYAYHTEVDATGEMAYAEVKFRKQFATVYLDILKPASEMARFGFLVEGNTCGFDLLNFEAVPGTFRFEPTVAKGARIVNFRVPRQVDDSMSLDIWYRHEDGMVDNLGSFPIGRYIIQTGYNWNTEELQDVYVVVDLVLGHIIISVDGWEHGQTFMYYEQ